LKDKEQKSSGEYFFLENWGWFVGGGWGWEEEFWMLEWNVGEKKQVRGVRSGRRLKGGVGWVQAWF
jgi:hypothetical protein